MSVRPANHWLPLPLRRFGGRAVERALNRLVALDPETRAALAKLDGRRIGVHLQGAELAFDLAVHQGALCVEPPQEADADASATTRPDLRVTATPFSLLALAVPREGDTLPPGKVEIAGDAELARRLEKLAREFAPDMEAAFARTFGEVLGVAIARALREARRWLGTRAQHAGADTADWLRDEARLVVPRGELDDFLDEVDALRERTERLQARVQRLRGRAA
ncbi:MAG: ubiquinone biosynthesis accessory factor UbiJ [Rhodanobacteraceae bacterium]